MVSLLLVSLLTSSSPSAEVAATLTELTAVAAAEVVGAEVVSTRDIEKIVALESQKQVMGCSAADCLAEVAGALGARLVVFSELGALDDQLLLTMNLYDAEAARSVSRELIRGGSAAAVGEAIPGAVHRLLDGPVQQAPARPVRVLVMNIAVTTTTTMAPSEAGGSVLGTVGLATIGVGGVVAVAGGVVGLMAAQSDSTANDPATTQREARAAYDARNGQALVANILFGSAAVVAGAGTALFLLGME
jgi:hypothetical protein